MMLSSPEDDSAFETMAGAASADAPSAADPFSTERRENCETNRL